MVAEWFMISELEEKVVELERDLKETKQALGKTNQDLEDVRFELEWERLLATNDAVFAAYDTVREYGEEAARSLMHAYRLTRDSKKLPRTAQHIARDIEKRRFRPFDPISVRRELESATTKPKHKGRVYDVDLGWEWKDQHFWTEREADQARQSAIDDAVASRTNKLPF